MSDDELPPAGAAAEDEIDLSDDDQGALGNAGPALPEGVQKTVVTEAPEANYKRPKLGDDVTVHYVGTLQADGSEFDSSRTGGEPLTFTLGKGEVIKGCELGIATMRQGEVAKFTIKPELAYGEEGDPPKVPPNATLVFEVELISWVTKEDLFGDGGATKVEVKSGSGWKKPRAGDEVRISLRAKSGAGGEVVEERQGVDYVLGAGEAFGAFARVLDKALEGMKKGEEVKLACSEDYACGPQRNGTVVELTLDQIYDFRDVSFAKDQSLMKKQVVEGEGYETPREAWVVTLKVLQATDGRSPIPGFAPETLRFTVGDGEVCDALELATAEMKKGEQALLTCTGPPEAWQEEKLGLKGAGAERAVFTLELVEFEKGPDIWAIPEEEKLVFGAARKEVGSALFRRGRFALASERYKRVGEMFAYVDSFKEPNKVAAKALKKTCDLNQAACQLKLRDWAGAKASCDKVIQEEPGSVKALFRRAQADFELKNYLECIADAKRVVELEPQNREARKLVKDAQAAQKEEDQKSRNVFSKMCGGLGKGPESPPAQQDAPEAVPREGREAAAAQSSSSRGGPPREAPPQADLAAAGGGGGAGVFGLPGLLWRSLGGLWSYFWKVVGRPFRAIGHNPA